MQIRIEGAPLFRQRICFMQIKKLRLEVSALNLHHRLVWYYAVGSSYEVIRLVVWFPVRQRFHSLFSENPSEGSGEPAPSGSPSHLN
jgi:hypothetical protein